MRLFQRRHITNRLNAYINKCKAERIQQSKNVDLPLLTDDDFREIIGNAAKNRSTTIFKG